MANTVTVRTLHDSSHRAIIHCWISSDGASGEVSDAVLVDVSGLSGSPTKVAILKVDACLNGFNARLEFDATTDVGAVALAADHETHLDWCDIGGLSNNAGDGVTGDILVTTFGLATSATDCGQITIEVLKNNVGSSNL